MKDDSAGTVLVESEIAHRYPGAIFYLGQVFNHTTNSYKLVWFLAILALLRQTRSKSLSVADILTEMVIIAWYPVCFYRLSLGRQDTLQDTVMKIRQTLNLPANAQPDAIRHAIHSTPSIRSSLLFLKTYVPTRFLTPWFADELRCMKDSLKDRTIRELAENRPNCGPKPPYKLRTAQDGQDYVEMNTAWYSFFQDNAAIIQAYAEHSLALYLQDRNPHVPGIVKKLRVPVARQLTTARSFWRKVGVALNAKGCEAEFRDIYSGRRIDDDFSVDHFLPWSFVVHDMLWNLTPVTSTTNSRKSDILPDIDMYLPRLARLHYFAIKATRDHPRLLEDYIACFRVDFESLAALTENDISARYRDMIVPQAQIAINQGFQHGWRWADGDACTS